MNLQDLKNLKTAKEAELATLSLQKVSSKLNAPVDVLKMQISHLQTRIEGIEDIKMAFEEALKSTQTQDISKFLNFKG